MINKFFIYVALYLKLLILVLEKMCDLTLSFSRGRMIETDSKSLNSLSTQSAYSGPGVGHSRKSSDTSQVNRPSFLSQASKLQKIKVYISNEMTRRIESRDLTSREHKLGLESEQIK
jgi:hypothetical protein